MAIDPVDKEEFQLFIFLKIKEGRKSERLVVHAREQVRKKRN